MFWLGISNLFDAFLFSWVRMLALCWDPVVRLALVSASFRHALGRLMLSRYLSQALSRYLDAYFGDQVPAKFELVG